MKIYNNILELIGNTPLIRINNFNEGSANIFAKVEYFNPAGSIKDRAALFMLEEAEKNGQIIPNVSTIIEPTSGNTGIGLALVCLIKGYKLILTMPETMSKERRDILSAYGAQIILTSGKEGMKGTIDKANQLHNEIKNSFIPQQFSNPSNSLSHYCTTSEEIYSDLDGNVDFVVAGIGTGGTISGIAKKLKEKNKNIKIIGFEPKSSPMITLGKAGMHKIQGIGANFIPDNYETDLVDEVMIVSDEDAYEYTRLLVQKEGILAGISSGAALWCANELSKRTENKDKNIVAILPDTGMRYLSTNLFD